MIVSLCVLSSCILIPVYSTYRWSQEPYGGVIGSTLHQWRARVSLSPGTKAQNRSTSFYAANKNRLGQNGISPSKFRLNKEKNISSSEDATGQEIEGIAFTCTE